ncbi:hypothetical protein C0992_004098 [Termitomyces sp. T32_za158]|nr:hypothetical protein C0992_004098 [Termitomyces sp. T32_za158]
MVPPETKDSSSPLKFHAVSRFEGKPSELDERREKVSREMAGFFLGPMPVQEFLDRFLPRKPGLGTQSRDPKHFSTVPINRTETAMYDPFIKCLQGLIPGFKVINTGSHSDQNSDPQRKIKPDPTMYKKSVDTSSGKTQFDKAELNIEFKREKSWEPFVDERNPNSKDPHPFESKTKQGRHTRAQLTDYMAEVFSRQHRIFGFSVFICGDMARFLRWDRAGVIVTAQFNYHESSKELVDFFWRFSHLDESQRGHDPNVRPANTAEIKLGKEKLSKWQPERKRRVVVFTVPGEDKMPREFIAWRSFAAPYSVTGRCTRAYPVYEKATDKCYFLKDLWRAHDLEPEANILRELAKKNVQHVPRFLCGGDIDGQRTESDVYASGAKTLAPWAIGDDWSRITQRIHHRFVVDFIGKPLSALENSKQLVQVVFDAYTGCRQAYEICGFVHRDISGRNILIDENGRGVLNDWDLAKHKDKLGESRRHERTGTWQFMSCLLLGRQHVVHTIQDDMESFVHVMLYFGLRYLQHNSTVDAPSLLKQIFDEQVINKEGRAVGGTQKKFLFTAWRKCLGMNFKFLSTPFQRWFEWAVRAANQWIDHCELLAEVEVGATQGAEPQLQFSDHSSMAQVFVECLNSQDWPTDEPRPIDAAPEFDGGSTRTSKRPYASEDIDDDSIGGSRKQSRTSNAIGSRGGGSNSQRAEEQLTSRGSNSQQTNAQLMSTMDGSRGGSNSKGSTRTSEHSMTTRSRTRSNHGG